MKLISLDNFGPAGTFLLLFSVIYLLHWVTFLTLLVIDRLSTAAPTNPPPEGEQLKNRPGP